MALRTLITPGRVIISKAGFTASPSLADENKTFDSQWAFLGRLTTTDFVLDTAAIAGGDPDETAVSAARQIAFPYAHSIIPQVFFWLIRPSDYNAGLWIHSDADLAGYNITTTGITINRRYDGETYRRMHILYWVFAI